MNATLHICVTALTLVSKYTPHFCTNKFKNAAYNYHAMPINVSAIHMLLKSHIFELVHCSYVSMYLPHMNSLQSTMWSKALVYIHFTLLAYAPEEICLPHHTYVPLS